MVTFLNGGILLHRTIPFINSIPVDLFLLRSSALRENLIRPFQQSPFLRELKAAPREAITDVAESDSRDSFP